MINQTDRIKTPTALVLILIMILGLYLALGSIFSLSYIKDSPDIRKAVVENFDSTFVFKKSLFINDSGVTEFQGMLKTIQSDIEEVPRWKAQREILTADKILRERIDNTIDIIHDSLAAHLDYLALLYELIAAAGEDYEAQMNKLFVTGRSKFHIAASRISSRLLTQYEQEWLEYATNYEAVFATSLHNNISNYRRNFATLSRLVHNSKDNVGVLLVKLENKDSLIQVNANSIMRFSFLPSISSYVFRKIDSIDITKLKEPKEGVIGQEWGAIFPTIIGFIAGSRNVDILLVFGMLGFGLFGAGIAIFISGQPIKNTNAGSYVLLIIVRGFSAAIVVYLAARGSIAVINKGVSDPDPLVLFLFCLIGSVYSERIWAWAKSKISSSFSPDKPKSKNAAQNDPIETT